MELMKFTVCFLFVLATTIMTTTRASEKEIPPHEISRRHLLFGSVKHCPTGMVLVGNVCHKSV